MKVMTYILSAFDAYLNIIYDNICMHKQQSVFCNVSFMCLSVLAASPASRSPSTRTGPPAAPVLATRQLRQMTTTMMMMMMTNDDT